MNPKVVWRVWCDPASKNYTHSATWGRDMIFTSRAEALKAIKRSNHSDEYWKFVPKKFPKRRVP